VLCAHNLKLALPFSAKAAKPEVLSEHRKATIDATTSVRLNVEQNQLLSRVGYFLGVLIGPQGAL
jgi:hypothetical protein